MNDDDRRMLRIAYEQARQGFDEGGCPIGSVLAEGATEIARGRNRRVQEGDPIAHGEMDCLRRAGRRPSYTSTTLYTTLSPCMMCAGTILQFGIPRVVIGDDRNFGGNEDFLRSRGVEVEVVNDPDCVELMARFIQEKPELWAEDIAEEADETASPVVDTGAATTQGVDEIYEVDTATTGVDPLKVVKPDA